VGFPAPPCSADSRACRENDPPSFLPTMPCRTRSSPHTLSLDPTAAQVTWLLPLSSLTDGKPRPRWAANMPSDLSSLSLTLGPSFPTGVNLDQRLQPLSCQLQEGRDYFRVAFTAFPNSRAAYIKSSLVAWNFTLMIKGQMRVRK
jgi:hypothetical protein